MERADIIILTTNRPKKLFLPVKSGSFRQYIGTLFGFIPEFLITEIASDGKIIEKIRKAYKEGPARINLLKGGGCSKVNGNRDEDLKCKERDCEIK